MDYSQYVAFWRKIATEHKDIFHFARFENEISDDLFKNVQYPALFLNDFDGELGRLSNGKWLDNTEGSIMIVSEIDFRNMTYDQMEAELDRLKNIGFEIFARIFHDEVLKNHCPEPIKRMKPESIKYYFTPYITEHVRGWYFDFKMAYNAEARLTFDVTKWEIE